MSLLFNKCIKCTYCDEWPAVYWGKQFNFPDGIRSRYWCQVHQLPEFNDKPQKLDGDWYVVPFKQEKTWVGPFMHYKQFIFIDNWFRTNKRWWEKKSYDC